MIRLIIIKFSIILLLILFSVNKANGMEWRWKKYYLEWIIFDNASPNNKKSR